uniref:15-oxoprostaglandin 13-reductase n=1 Tax=Phallusia mammillata TaxID=59560 RepID=A0A6F9DWP6_9ASCI|nr:zinc-binding alcohol dehydrogenase domain-containing protein 2-like [Phallusia mammillata]
MSSTLPSTMKKLVVRALTANFKEAIEMQTVHLPKLKPTEVLVKNHFVGINASDINFTAGKYNPGLPPPFDAGFEAVGEVVAVGSDIPESYTGTSVAHLSNGAFSEYQAVSQARLFPLKSTDPSYLPCLVSGMTANLAFRNSGYLKPTDKVLVTAAAGGTGQFAVQLAKLAGCHVIGTCSTDEKVKFLKSIGCDHPINIKAENLNTVLKKHYPQGVDVVYESVGGETYETCVNRLAPKGRLIVIGYISGYQEPMGVANSKSARAAAALPVKLLMKSASVKGFFLFHYVDQWKQAFQEMAKLVESQQIKSAVDRGESIKQGGFNGIEEIKDAVDYLYSKKSRGKVVVCLNKSPSKL